MTSRNGSKGSQNQNAPGRHGKLSAEFGQEISGDNNKGTDYRSKKGSKSQLKNPSNH